ncbi:hypothetical protein ACFV42_48110 [Streptomyces solisilvae]|uniref:hypothetical protein n=1 Tax=Streptomyces malaysiensis TaxID=92644 RepID=UPI0036A96789
MSWQIIPVANAARGPQPDGVPDRPVIPYDPWPTIKRPTPQGRDITDLSALSHSARHVRAELDRQRSEGIA